LVPCYPIQSSLFLPSPFVTHFFVQFRVLWFLFFFIMILDSTSSNTIKSSRIWLDYAESLSLSQFFGECRFVSIN
jgi:hypothetical protein